ncbi:alpha/beta hydrolase [Desulfosarcina cetonica]|uniref:alpha/beta hydrolase n=1 Tax=Desulfosarcina cetonica TaxID=90730 RepID=UPI0006D0851C|nr:alpha/beta hydrolase [Desulfosarcina cetonica]
MGDTACLSDGRPWHDYYAQFSEFSDATVRPGCQPWVFTHATPAAKAVVLCHGLTDSPYFLKAIGRYFHHQLGYDVYLPLLQGHGLKKPKGMEGVQLEAWKANVDFAVRTAAGKAASVSIGGLSTGGTLSVYTACTDPTITGDLFLFSAALDLAGGPGGVIGEMKERLLLTPLADLLDSDAPLIGPNPYRYARMDMDGARELARLIKETDALLSGFDTAHPFPTRFSRPTRRAIPPPISREFATSGRKPRISVSRRLSFPEKRRFPTPAWCWPNRFSPAMPNPEIRLWKPPTRCSRR